MTSAHGSSSRSRAGIFQCDLALEWNPRVTGKSLPGIQVSFSAGEQYDASAIPRAFAGRCGSGSIQRHQSDVPGAEMEVLLKVMRDKYRTRSRCNHFIGIQSLIRIAFNDDWLVDDRILDGADDLIDLLLTCGIECGAFMFATKQLVGKG